MMDIYDCSQLMEEMVCRFYVTTGCLDGEECLFPHVDSDARVPDTVCRYFMKGKCMFGRYCRFNHVVVFRSEGGDATRSYGEVYQMTETESQNQVLIANMEKFKVPVLLSSESESKTRREGGEASESKLHYHPVVSASVKSEPTFSYNPTPYNEPLGFDLSFKQCLSEESCPYTHSYSVPIRPIDPRGPHKCRMKCGLCDKRVNLPPSDDQFGQLQNCSHLFCLDCILVWNGISRHKNKSVYKNVHVHCPECRKYSRNILPSHVWMRDLAMMYN